MIPGKFFTWKNILLVIMAGIILWFVLWKLFFNEPVTVKADDTLKNFILEEKQQIIESNRRTMEFVDSSIQNLDRYEKLDSEDSVFVHNSNLDTKLRLLDEYMARRHQPDNTVRSH